MTPEKVMELSLDIIMKNIDEQVQKTLGDRLAGIPMQKSHLAMAQVGSAGAAEYIFNAIRRADIPGEMQKTIFAELLRGEE